MTKRIWALFISALLAFTVLGMTSVSADTNNENAVLHTEGNLLVNASGQSIRLLGLNIPYMGWDDNSEAAVMSAVNISIEEWSCN